MVTILFNESSLIYYTNRKSSIAKERHAYTRSQSRSTRYYEKSLRGKVIDYFIGYIYIWCSRSLSFRGSTENVHLTEQIRGDPGSIPGRGVSILINLTFVSFNALSEFANIIIHQPI